MSRFKIGDKVRVVADRDSRKRRPNAIAWVGREGVIVNWRAGRLVVRIEEGTCPECGHKSRKYPDFTSDEVVLVEDLASDETQHLRKRLWDLKQEMERVEKRLSSIDPHSSQATNTA